MGWFDGISGGGQTLRVRHNVWGFTWGLLVIGVGILLLVEADREISPGFRDFAAMIDDHRTLIVRGLVALGALMALWRKTIVFDRLGNVKVVRHLYILPWSRKFPREEIRCLGTGADVVEASWYTWSRYRMVFSEHGAESVVYVAYVVFRDSTWTELFRCRGDADFQRRIERIQEFTDLPIRRK